MRYVLSPSDGSVRLQTVADLDAEYCNLGKTLSLKSLANYRRQLLPDEIG